MEPCSQGIAPEFPALAPPALDALSRKTESPKRADGETKKPGISWRTDQLHYEEGIPKKHEVLQNIYLRKNKLVGL